MKGDKALSAISVAALPIVAAVDRNRCVFEDMVVGSGFDLYLADIWLITSSKCFLMSSPLIDCHL